MSQDRSNPVQDAADQVIGLEEELEVSSDALTADDQLARARAALHAWVDSATAVIVTPALGRVTVIHPGGVRSTIGSPSLPFAMSHPIKPGTAD